MPISSDLLKRIILDQREDLRFPKIYIQRTVQNVLDRLSQNREIIVLSGIRRCGKSVLLEHVRRMHESGNDYYFNFEDERLVNFELDDPSTKEREISGLIEAVNKFFLSAGLIITENEEGDEVVERIGKKYQIIIKPIWKWLRELI